ncbi:MAG: pyruvate kinase [Thermoanaerobaculia bacterium]|nr:pyruvate kinase [Thermoanaerobaculia bacterium]
MSRRTKIIATLGPASSGEETIQRMVAAGMDVARLNFSHGDHESHRVLAARVRRAAEAEGKVVALLQDIQGPKLRVGSFPGGSTVLEAGETVRLRPGQEMGNSETLWIAYDHLLNDVEVGDPVLLADGHIRLQVTESKSSFLRATVQAGGTLENQQGVAFPRSELRTPSVTSRDEQDLEFGRELEVDWVAASFVRSAEDLRQVRRFAGPDVPVMAKIELAVAFDRLDSILAEADGAMVARGDLGVQLPLQKIPRIQTEILRRTNRSGGLSVTATEMLESMIHSHRPTRAEVTDVVSAVHSGTDAVMLSGETAVGDHPVRVIEVMDDVCREAEDSAPSVNPTELLLDEEPFPSATAKAAVGAAESLDLKTIVAFTESGSTARLISKYRPHASIVAFTPDERTRRRMALYWGVRPVLYDRLESTDSMIAFADRRLRELDLSGEGEAVVIVAGVPPNERHSTNLIKLHQISS